MQLVSCNQRSYGVLWANVTCRGFWCPGGPALVRRLIWQWFGCPAFHECNVYQSIRVEIYCIYKLPEWWSVLLLSLEASWIRLFWGGVGPLYPYLSIGQTDCNKKQVLYYVLGASFLLSSILPLFDYVEQTNGRDGMEEAQKIMMEMRIGYSSLFSLFESLLLPLLSQWENTYRWCVWFFIEDAY